MTKQNTWLCAGICVAPCLGVCLADTVSPVLDAVGTTSGYAGGVAAT